MPKQQQFPVSAPLETDKESLKDFSATVNRNFEDLFGDAHTHDVRTTAPASSEGSIGDILPVVLSGVYYLYVKFPTVGWKRVAVS